MKIQEIKHKNIWEDFLKNCSEKTFLQSWNWGEFQNKMGNKIWRLGIYENRELFSATLAIKVIAKRGTFLLVQHGPNVRNYKSQIPNSKQPSNHKLQILSLLLEKLKEIGKKENCSFIRIAPLLPRNEENKKLFQSLGFLKASMHASAYEATLKIDISLPTEMFLQKMRKTTRYLIRQAMKSPEIEIIKSNNAQDVKLYDKLNQEVVKLHQFTPFSFEFVKNEFEVFVKDNQGLLFFGKYQDQIIAAALIIFWSDIGFYHHAALLPTHRKIPIAYLLQWEAIKEAKKRGCLFYDFWGYVDPKKHSRHPWAGPTLFKLGFGGKPYEYIETLDLPLSRKYWLTYIFEKLRRIKRGV
ncbi:MAG: peptidoglycan bridge formation glycyltransferase FemA/FemB family protein [Candidatus Nealsonbacteria bacterium]|nr:peptidoglycan bridge formation glycyltransferase FemA/FemB family protein [Candidatus Nealsonbacteria bacterium]